MSKMELHKDDMQLLLIVLAHGLSFCVVAVILSFLSFSAASSWTEIVTLSSKCAEQVFCHGKDI